MTNGNPIMSILYVLYDCGNLSQYQLRSCRGAADLWQARGDLEGGTTELVPTPKTKNFTSNAYTGSVAGPAIKH